MKANLNKALEYINRQQHFLFFVAVLLLFSFIVWRIGTAIDPEPDPVRVQQLLSEVDQVKFDQEKIERLRALNDSNVDISSDFTDRDNPFVE